MSIQTDRAKAVARNLGGFAGHDCAHPLWVMSKCELVEVAMRLGAMNAGDPDDPESGLRAALHEYHCLSVSGIL